MSRFILPFQSAFDINGHPLDGAKLFFFETGTNTPKDTFSDSGLTTANTNPVIANNQGEFNEIFLKGTYRVELKDKNDVTQPNYPADGVPNADEDAIYYDTVALMKLASITAGRIAITKGYYASGDGGGAEYLVVAPQSFDGFADHELANSNISVLQVDDYYNARQFGLKEDGSFDDTVALEAAQDYIEALGGGTLLIRGIAAVTKIVLHHSVSIIGLEGLASGFKVLTSSETEFVQLGVGPIIGVSLKDLSFNNNGFGNSAVVAGQWGMTLIPTAQIPSPFDGGLFDFRFENLRFNQFDNGIWLKGGGPSNLLPHQFGEVIGCYVSKAVASGIALKLTGQVSQVKFIGGRYDGRSGDIGTGTNIILGTDAFSSTETPSFIDLHTVTQNAQFGVDITTCSNIDVAVWFENVHYGVTVRTASLGINVNHCRFANAAQDGSGGGYAASFGSSCRGSFKYNYILGNIDDLVKGTNSNGVDIGGNVFGNGSTISDGLTAGVTKQLGVASNAIAAHGHTAVVVNTSVDNITTITSSKLPGESIFITPLSGSIVFATGGNISLGGRTSPYTVQQNTVVQFIRVDLAGTWLLVGSAPNVALLTDNSGGSASDTLAAITDAATKDAVASLAAKINAILAAM